MSPAAATAATTGERARGIRVETSEASTQLQLRAVQQLQQLHLGLAHRDAEVAQRKPVAAAVATVAEPVAATAWGAGARREQRAESREERGERREDERS
jgi:hypothetical protein